MEVQAEQEVRWAIGGPQAPSVMDANIDFGLRQAPVHLTTILEFIFILLLSYFWFLDVHQVIGVELVP
jgi:hypothetical protein